MALEIGSGISMKTQPEVVSIENQSFGIAVLHTFIFV